MPPAQTASLPALSPVPPLAPRRLRRLARWGAALGLFGLLAACGEVEHPSAPRGRAAAASSAGARPGGLVEKLPSVFGTALVFDDGPWRCIAINTRASIQSCIHRQRPLDFRYEYVQLLLAGSLAAEAPKRGVLLGLGGAGIVHLLRQTRPGLAMDVVEIDGAVVTLAKRHFRYQPRAGERVYVEDAARWVARPAAKGRYDLVLLDCFGEHHIPTSLLTLPFFEAVRRLLSPGGVLVANLWASHPQYPAIVKRYRGLYRSVRILPGATSGNAILVARPQGPLPEGLTLYRRAQAVDAQGRVPFRVAPHLLRIK